MSDEWRNAVGCCDRVPLRAWDAPLAGSVVLKGEVEAGWLMPTPYTHDLAGGPEGDGQVDGL